MSSLPDATSTADHAPPSPQRALRRLFLALFLRGSSSRGLTLKRAPQSVASKLALTLTLYLLVGAVAFGFQRQPVFMLSAYLHAMTFVLLGMFVAASAGEVLFNNQEADILLHRPVTPQMLLWAKIRVLVEVSLWLAGAFNLVGFYVGLKAPNGSLLFLPAHALSILLEALFCTSAVVVVYQLCLRYCGREKLDGLMTTAQIVVTIGAVLGGQFLPRFIFDPRGNPVGEDSLSRWIFALPPAWFAGLDDLLTTGFSPRSGLLAAMALASTGLFAYLAFDRLARDYGRGIQTIAETVSRGRRDPGRRWLDRLIDRPPLAWMLRNPVTRASFLLAAAYLARDRDVKLRVYPGVAPFLAMPLIFLFPQQGQDHASGFLISLSGAYLGMTPMFSVSILQFSQQWQAADVFRAAPISGPAAICAGARQAVFWLLALPLVLVIVLVVALTGKAADLPLLLPGILLLPVYLMVPHLGGRAVPLSVPGDQANSAGRGLHMIAAMLCAIIVTSLATAADYAGYLWPLLGVELLVVATAYFWMRSRLAAMPWRKSE
ncbi:MAG TPA: hypothetical protein VMF30_00840 [Pirellulales bacterium]|nr:hypothetical protein [Pirellulales bacterium]